MNYKNNTGLFGLILIVIIFSNIKIYPQDTMKTCIKALNKIGTKINDSLIPLYDTDRLYTGAMSLYCLADTVCSASDLSTLALAGVAIAIAVTYDPDSEQRCFWIPQKYNFVADALASTVSAPNLSGTTTERDIRAAIDIASSAATMTSLIPTDLSVDYSNAIDYENMGVAL